MEEFFPNDSNDFNLDSFDKILKFTFSTKKTLTFSWNERFKKLYYNIKFTFCHCIIPQMYVQKRGISKLSELKKSNDFKYDEFLVLSYIFYCIEGDLNWQNIIVHKIFSIQNKHVLHIILCAMNFKQKIDGLFSGII